MKNYVQTYNIYPFGEYLHFIPADNVMIDDIKKYLYEKGHNALEIFETAPEIEDCFMEFSR